MRSSRDEVIETSVLMKLALIAAANDRTIEEELNLAVQTYINEQWPAVLAERSAEEWAHAGAREATVDI